MYVINKITSNHTVDFAAEELKKYLRMMMVRSGEIDIRYSPDATDGFRLGVMADFGLNTSEAEDVTLDDIVHIDCDENGGIIAGSNPRSVLLAVYQYLRENGCRWLFPGIDGEYIPMRDIEPVKYHKMASCRYRGQCNEGAEAQHLMMEAIDFTPKIGMNIFMIEFDNPAYYYEAYYNHHQNPVREPEPITKETVLQWKRQCEAEISKRGLQLHDMGHGWTASPFGIDTAGGWNKDESEIPEEVRPYLAEIGGKREFFMGIPINTNFCMSNPEARGIVAKYVADYAERATNVDYLHVWLADSRNNHCECAECQKKIPSDWYMMLMNDIDAALTEKGLKTRIVFICYVDTMWAPETVTVTNPDRFSLLLAAITRDYTKPVTQNLDMNSVELKPYVRNKTTLPSNVDEYIVHGKNWRDKCKVRSFVYEYHYWKAQYRDLGVLDAARIIYDDVKGYRSNGYEGIVEDGSQRSYFPNGFSYYTYASTLFDTSVDFEELKRDYFSHAYGKDWEKVVEFFEKMGKLADFRYFNTKMSKDPSRSGYYNPEIAEDFRKAIKLAEDFRPFVKAHRKAPYRAEALSYKLLDYYLDYCVMILGASIEKAQGNDDKAHELFVKLKETLGIHEPEIELWFDQYMMYVCYWHLFG